MNSNEFTIYPAVHLRNGEVVRFSQGDTHNPIVFHTDPIACVQQWIDQGAKWIQLVNIDAAFNEDATNNWDLVRKICQLDVNIQFGGGIRSMDDVDWAIKSGIERVIIGTAAVVNPQLMADAIAHYGADAIILSIDADAEGEVQIHGWRAGAAVQASGLAIQMRQLGVKSAIHTSIHLDGSMTGIDLEASIELARISGLNLTVGGGIGSLKDVVECYNYPGIDGVIVGKALYTGKLNLKKALRAAQQKNSFEASLDEWKAHQKTTWARFSYDLVENNLKKHIAVDSPPLRVLDAGGGNGLDSLALARMNHQIDIVDISQQMLKDANANAALAGVSGRVKTHAVDISSLGELFHNSEFDLILCHNLIQYIDELETLFETLAGLAKPGAVLSLIAPNQFSLPYQAAFLEGDLDEAYRLLDQGEAYSSIFGVDEKNYRAADIIDSLASAGFSLKSHYGIRCMYNYWGNNEKKAEAEVYEKLKKLEYALTDREPYKQTARLFQLVLQK